MRLLVLILLAFPLPLRADPPPALPLDGDALYGCFELVDTGEAGSDAGRALCAGAAAEPCIAEAEEEAEIAACIDAERAIWEQEAAGWVALVAAEMKEPGRGVFLDEADARGAEDAADCGARWPEGSAPLARCRLERAALWLQVLGSLYDAVTVPR